MKIYNKHFSDRLLSEIDRKKSVVIVGLDPDYQKIPLSIRPAASSIKADELSIAAEAIFAFNKCIIDIVAPYVPAVKPQIAFYERYGVAGIRAFAETVNYAKQKNLIVIEDAKRNDIGHTAQAYADGHIGVVKIGENSERAVFNVDAITINPYLGIDGIKPFIDSAAKYGKGIFILVKTSNPSSTELQDLFLNEKEIRLYEYVATFVNKWGKALIGLRGYSSVGAVVGATFQKHAKALRKIMPNTIFLVPGYGAQGASAKDIVGCFNKDGYGAIISASRSIIYPHGENLEISENSFKESVENAIEVMNNDIKNALKEVGSIPW